ncbi:MAG TPA: ATP-binding protein [Nocardioidaceae bacterium]
MFTQNTWLHEAAWDSAPANIRRVRAFVSDCLHRHGLVRVEAECLLVATELATNAVMHTRMPFSVAVCQDAGAVLILVHDLAPGTVDLRQTGSAADRGRGLFVVGQISIEWGVNDDEDGLGKTVWARIA